MGVVMRANCEGCDYNKSFYLGAGLTFRDLTSVKAIFADTVTKEIDSYIGQFDFDAEYVLALCEKCNKLAQVAKITIKPHDGDSAVVYNLCECGSRSVREIPAHNKIDCPKCGIPVGLEQSGKWS